MGLEVNRAFYRVNKMLHQSNVVELLQKWGVWLARRESNGLGYKQSSLNLLGAAPSSSCKVALLPYGVDEDEVFGAIDRAVCGLPKLYRLILLEEYCVGGLSAHKYKAIGVGKTSYFKYLGLAHGQICEQFLNRSA